MTKSVSRLCCQVAFNNKYNKQTSNQQKCKRVCLEVYKTLGEG
jgi:hypothetical protein